jgi:hypothetical protein
MERLWKTKKSYYKVSNTIMREVPKVGTYSVMNEKTEWHDKTNLVFNNALLSKDNALFRIKDNKG